MECTPSSNFASMTSSEKYDWMSRDNWHRRVCLKIVWQTCVHSSFHVSLFTNTMRYFNKVDSAVCKNVETVDRVTRVDMRRNEHTYRTKSPFASVLFTAAVAVLQLCRWCVGDGDNKSDIRVVLCCAVLCCAVLCCFAHSQLLVNISKKTDKQTGMKKVCLYIIRSEQNHGSIYISM